MAHAYVRTCGGRKDAGRVVQTFPLEGVCAHFGEFKLHVPSHAYCDRHELQSEHHSQLIFISSKKCLY